MRKIERQSRAGSSVIETPCIGQRPKMPVFHIFAVRVIDIYSVMSQKRFDNRLVTVFNGEQQSSPTLKMDTRTTHTYSEHPNSVSRVSWHMASTGGTKTRGVQVLFPQLEPIGYRFHFLISRNQPRKKPPITQSHPPIFRKRGTCF